MLAALHPRRAFYGPPPKQGEGLVLDRAETTAGIWAMLWTAIDDDPRLLESKHFKSEAALQVWRAGIGARYGRENIRVNWTDALRTDDRLSVVLKDCVGAIAPDA
jgi:hypothetical protein